jgi:hypothetical protein
VIGCLEVAVSEGAKILIMPVPLHQSTRGPYTVLK